MPMLRLLPARSCRAASLRTKPSRSIAACTLATVSGATLSGWLSTFETVPTETDAAAATSRTLTDMPSPSSIPTTTPAARDPSGRLIAVKRIKARLSRQSQY